MNIRHLKLGDTGYEEAFRPLHGLHLFQRSPALLAAIMRCLRRALFADPRECGIFAKHFATAFVRAGCEAGRSCGCMGHKGLCMEEDVLRLCGAFDSIESDSAIPTISSSKDSLGGLGSAETHQVVEACSAMRLEMMNLLLSAQYSGSTRRAHRDIGRREAMASLFYGFYRDIRGIALVRGDAVSL